MQNFDPGLGMNSNGLSPSTSSPLLHPATAPLSSFTSSWSASRPTASLHSFTDDSDSYFTEEDCQRVANFLGIEEDDDVGPPAPSSSSIGYINSNGITGRDPLVRSALLTTSLGNQASTLSSNKLSYESLGSSKLAIYNSQKPSPMAVNYNISGVGLANIGNDADYDDFDYAPTGGEMYPQEGYIDDENGEFSDDGEESLSAYRPLCTFFVRGTCRYGSSCRYVHGQICERCLLPTLNYTSQIEWEAHLASCAGDPETKMELEDSKSLDCCICGEKTMSLGRRFGILPNCDHIFCLECIRDWRGGSTSVSNSSTTRSCPICREVSYFIVPCDRFIVDEERKKREIDSYLAAMKKKRCKFYREGESECPFGSSCFYAHVNQDGSEAPVTRPRTVIADDGEDGAVRVRKGVRLAEFLFPDEHRL